MQGFRWENQRGKDCLQDLGVNGRIILNGSSKHGIGRNGLVWLRIGTGGRLLCCVVR